MVKPQFSDLDIEIWMHHEKLGVSQPSLCLYHSSKQSGIELLSALEEMQAEGVPTKRTLTFQPTKRPGCVTTLRIRLLDEHIDLRVMNIACTPSVADIEITPIGREIIHNGLSSWLDGLEDFGVSSRDSQLRHSELGQLDRASGELWFWGPTLLGP